MVLLNKSSDSYDA